MPTTYNIFPQYINSEFYKKFNDPHRAYSCITDAYYFYATRPAVPVPGFDQDYMILAWKIAHQIPAGEYTQPGGPHGLDHTREFYAS